MGAASSLHYHRVRTLRFAEWIFLAALLIALVLLVSAAFAGVTSPGHSPANEPVLMGPFRWPAHTGLA